MHVKLLSSIEMAEFVAHGLLTFEGVVPEAINERAVAEIEELHRTWGTSCRRHTPTQGAPWQDAYERDSAFAQMLSVPIVAGAITSLVGRNAGFDHDSANIRPAKSGAAQFLHADAVVDVSTAFDIQVFYFPAIVDPDGGGTGYIRGSHLRIVNESDIARYHHLIGERQWSGRAGSVLIFHHGLWHRGESNWSGRDRHMFRVRLNPMTPQVKLWNHTDIAPHRGPEVQQRIAQIFRSREAWVGQSDHRLDQVARTRLWRYLTGDPEFDTPSRMLQRIEAKLQLGGEHAVL